MVIVAISTMATMVRRRAPEAGSKARVSAPEVGTKKIVVRPSIIPREIPSPPVTAEVAPRIQEPTTTPAGIGVATQEVVENSIGMKLVLIASGEFAMGAGDKEMNADADEKPSHRVRITRPFWLGATEVTQGQYREVVGDNPSSFSAERSNNSDVAGKDTSEYPVENVSWNQAIAFCNTLSELEGRNPYYRINPERATVEVEGGAGYRLPTEAEWEYACRGGAGDSRPYSFGKTDLRLGQYAWFGGNSGWRTHPVAQKKPNGFGLYDIYGNVDEWCWDNYDAGYYRESPSEDPSGPARGSDRVRRGGSQVDSPWNLRSADRHRSLPTVRDNEVGFRVARDTSGGKGEGRVPDRRPE